MVRVRLRSHAKPTADAVEQAAPAERKRIAETAPSISIYQMTEAWIMAVEQETVLLLSISAAGMSCSCVMVPRAEVTMPIFCMARQCVLGIWTEWQHNSSSKTSIRFVKIDRYITKETQGYAWSQGEDGTTHCGCGRRWTKRQALRRRNSGQQREPIPMQFAYQILLKSSAGERCRWAGAAGGCRLSCDLRGVSLSNT